MDIRKRKTTEEHLTGCFDVLIVGGGNAALCAAMTAREAGARVLLLECAPIEFRGGNSRHTRNIRYLHTQSNAFLTGPYLEKEFWEDLQRVTGGNNNPELARLTIRQSRDVGHWMAAHGCQFQPAMKGTLHLARTNAFFLGGGKALINAYYATADRLGVKIVYDADVMGLDVRDGVFLSASVRRGNRIHTVRAQSLVLAAGGFQANREWLKHYWGEAAENFLIRGTPFDRGQLLKIMMDHGAETVGDPKQCHAVAIDARAPREDGGIVTRLDCVPFGIAVNKEGRRFYDEGEDFWPKRYAIWGRLVAAQPDQIAFVIIDAKSIDLFMPSVFPPVHADSIPELAQKMGLEAPVVMNTVAEFNDAVQAGRFDPGNLDDCGAPGLEIPKSHWARPLDTPPYYGYPLRPGITFTYHGLKIDRQTRVIMNNGPASNIFAAGEIMSGNVLGQGYLAGFGMTIGTVFGQIAGKEAAYHAVK